MRDVFQEKAGDTHLRPGDPGTRDPRQHLHRGEGGGLSGPPHRAIHRDHADPHPRGPGGVPPPLRDRRGRDHHAILKGGVSGNRTLRLFKGLSADTPAGSRIRKCVGILSEARVFASK